MHEDTYLDALLEDICVGSNEADGDEELVELVDDGIGGYEEGR